MGLKLIYHKTSLTHFILTLSPEAAISLLGIATSRVIYNPWCVVKQGSSIYSVPTPRETHVNAPTSLRGALYQA